MDLLNNTRQFETVEMNRKTGMFSQYDALKFKIIGRKFQEISSRTENMASRFSMVNVQFGLQKMLLPGVFMMILRITGDIERSKGHSFESILDCSVSH